MEKKELKSAAARDLIENDKKSKCSDKVSEIESACEVPLKENQEKITHDKSNKEALEQTQTPENESLHPSYHGVASLSN